MVKFCSQHLQCKPMIWQMMFFFYPRRVSSSLFCHIILVPSHSPLIFPTYLLLSSTPTPSSSPSSSSFLSSNSYPNLPHSSSLLKTHSSPHLSHFFFFSSSSPFPLLYPLHLLPPFPFFVMYYFVLKFLFHCSLYCIEVWCFFFMDLLLVCFFFGCSSSPPSMLPNFFLSFSSSRFTVTKWAIIFFKCVDL